jgi:broad specificity phosphatase PhoE
VGRSDPPLTALGKRQAEAAGRSLAAELRRDRETGADPMTPVRLLSSPLRRAVDTAEIVGSRLASVCDVEDVVVEHRLIELDYGDLDGVPLAEVPASEWDLWRHDADHKPPNGESLSELQARCVQIFEELLEDAVRRKGSGTTVIAVSHVSPIKAAVAWVLGTGPEISWRLHLPVASLTRLRLGRSGPVLRSFGETGHLLSPPD